MRYNKGVGDDARMRPWPHGAEGAISLSYDRMLACHREVVLPELTKRQIPATFFADPTALLDSIDTWREAFARGHEIGNGCLLSAASDDGSLPLWTPDMIDEDIEVAESLLEELFGIREPTFAFPWGPPRCARRMDYRQVVEMRGLVARSGTTGTNPPGSCYRSYLKMVPVDGQSASTLIELAEGAVRRGEWIIFAFEGVGEGRRSVDLKAHRDLLAWIDQQRERVYVDTIGNAALALEQVRAARFRLA